jgi:hypothetical protein
MSEERQPQFHNYDDGGNSSNVLRNVIFGVAAVYIICSLYFSYSLNNRINTLEAKQTAAEQQLDKKIAATQSAVESASADLNKQVGLTQKQIAARAAELQRQQKASETRLTEEQQKQQVALGAVGTDVAGVKTEVAGAKTDITWKRPKQSWSERSVT